MSYLIVSRVQIRDSKAMASYIAAAPATVVPFGGKYHVRGGAVEALEGTWEHDRMVVLEFSDKASALAWYHSEAYRPLRELRQASADTIILLAEGLNAPAE